MPADLGGFDGVICDSLAGFDTGLPLTTELQVTGAGALSTLESTIGGASFLLFEGPFGLPLPIPGAGVFWSSDPSDLAGLKFCCLLSEGSEPFVVNRPSLPSPLLGDPELMTLPETFFWLASEYVCFLSGAIPLLCGGVVLPLGLGIMTRGGGVAGCVFLRASEFGHPVFPLNPADFAFLRSGP